MDNAATAQKVKALLIRESKSTLLAEQIGNEDSIVSGRLKIDSLTFIRVVVALEEALGIAFEDEKIMNTSFATVGDLIDYVTAARAERAA